MRRPFHYIKVACDFFFQIRSTKFWCMFRIRWSILWYCSIFIIPSIFLSWPTLASLKQPQTITEPPLCFIFGTIQSGFNLSLTLLRTYWRRWLPKCLNFDSSVHKTDFHWSIVHTFLFKPAFDCRDRYWWIQVFIDFSTNFRCRFLSIALIYCIYIFFCLNDWHVTF